MNETVIVTVIVTALGVIWKVMQMMNYLSEQWIPSHIDILRTLHP